MPDDPTMPGQPELPASPSAAPDPDADAESGPDELEELKERYAELRTLFTATFVALLVLSAGINLFIVRQVRTVRRQLDEQQSLLNRAMKEYRQKTEPELRRFTSMLQAFASTNRDAQPILERYRPALPEFLGPPILPGSAAINPSGRLPVVPAAPATSAPARPAPARPAGR
jgi:hypothetical protein